MTNVTTPNSTPEERRNAALLLNVEEGNVLVINPDFISQLSKLSSHHEGLNLFVDFFEGWNHLEDGYLWSYGSLDMFKSMVRNITANLKELHSHVDKESVIASQCNEIILTCEEFLAS